MKKRKWCCYCNKNKLFSEFYKNKSRKDKVNGVCKSCMKLIRPSYGNYYETEKNRALQKKFGITLEEYQNLAKKQNYVCAICARPERKVCYKGTDHEKIQALCVDHNHKTKKIRGLLCDACNIALGKLEENIDSLKQAIVYLKKHTNRSKVK